MLKTIHEFLLIQRRTLMYRKNCVGVEVPGTWYLVLSVFV